MSRPVALFVVAALVAGCATTPQPWSQDLSNCAKSNRAQAISALLIDVGQFEHAQIVCMRQLGWSRAGFGYLKPTSPEEDPNVLLQKACASDKRYQDKVWFQGHWEDC